MLSFSLRKKSFFRSAACDLPARQFFPFPEHDDLVKSQKSGRQTVTDENSGSALVLPVSI
jgi:hypothetical protein